MYRTGIKLVLGKISPVCTVWDANCVPIIEVIAGLRLLLLLVVTAVYTQCHVGFGIGADSESTRKDLQSTCGSSHLVQ